MSAAASGPLSSSAHAAPSPAGADCSACLEPLPAGFVNPYVGCEHADKFCLACWSRLVLAQLREGSFPPACPECTRLNNLADKTTVDGEQVSREDFEATGKRHEAHLRRQLKSELVGVKALFDELDTVESREALQLMSELDKFPCPHGCGGEVRGRNGEVGSEACSLCKEMFCTYCHEQHDVCDTRCHGNSEMFLLRKSWNAYADRCMHEILDIHQKGAKLREQYAKLEAYESELAGSRNLRYCPHCSKLCFKESGCPSMRCGYATHGDDLNKGQGCGRYFHWDSAPRYTGTATLEEDKALTRIGYMLLAAYQDEARRDQSAASTTVCEECGQATKDAMFGALSFENMNKRGVDEARCCFDCVTGKLKREMALKGLLGEDLKRRAASLIAKSIRLDYAPVEEDISDGARGGRAVGGQGPNCERAPLPAEFERREEQIQREVQREVNVRSAQGTWDPYKRGHPSVIPLKYWQNPWNEEEELALLESQVRERVDRSGDLADAAASGLERRLRERIGRVEHLAAHFAQFHVYKVWYCDFQLADELVTTSMRTGASVPTRFFEEQDAIFPHAVPKTSWVRAAPSIMRTNFQAVAAARSSRNRMLKAEEEYDERMKGQEMYLCRSLCNIS